jgi:hypothetical protein
MQKLGADKPDTGGILLLRRLVGWNFIDPGNPNSMAKVFTIPVPPKIGRKRRERTADPRYVDGQRLLVEAMKYLAQADPVANRSAIELLSEHVRTRFRMSDSPLS